MCLSPADMNVASLKRHIKSYKRTTKEVFEDRNKEVPDYRKRHLAALKDQLKKRKAEEKAGKKVTVTPRHVNSTFDATTVHGTDDGLYD